MIQLKKYNVKIRSIKENEITVLATCKNEALSKVEELLACSNLLNINIKGQTKHYVVLDANRIPVFGRKKHHFR